MPSTATRSGSSVRRSQLCGHHTPSTAPGSAERSHNASRGALVVGEVICPIGRRSGQVVEKSQAAARAADTRRTCHLPTITHTDLDVAPKNFLNNPLKRPGTGHHVNKVTSHTDSVGAETKGHACLKANRTSWSSGATTSGSAT